MELARVGPALDGARAQLVLALLGFALLPFLLMAFPRTTHGLTFERGRIREELTPSMTADHAGWIQPYNRSVRRSRPYLAREYFTLAPNPSGPRHRLDLLPTGRLLFDSRPVDAAGLRSRLDLLLDVSGWIDFHPHPEARFEDFIEAMAAVSRSDFDRLRLDNERYAEAFEAASKDAGGAP